MPIVAKIGSDSSGHDSCPSVKCIEGSSLLYVNGTPVARVGDHFASHGCTTHSPHSGAISAGSSFVFDNGIPVARVTDPIGNGGCPSSHVIVTGDSLINIDA